jgi:hypothetical protein
MEFSDRWAVIVWICQNQLGRRNITAEQKAVLIAQEYDAQKNSEAFHGNQYVSGNGEIHHHQIQDTSKTTTRAIVARAHGITENAVKSAVEFSHGLDSANKIVPGFKDAVLTGAVKAPKSVILRPMLRILLRISASFNGVISIFWIQNLPQIIAALREIFGAGCRI